MMEVRQENTGMGVKVKRMYVDAKMPTRGSAGAAGLDLYAYIRDERHRGTGITINAHKCYEFGSGIAIEIPDGYVGLLFARSGLGITQQLAPPNCVGVIDSDYRGQVTLPLQNGGNRAQVVKHGDRIGQLVIMPCPSVNLIEVESLSDTERGTRGHGSTGRN